MKDPNGAYSQLIRLQETRDDERRKIQDSEVPNSLSKSTSLSVRRSMTNVSFGNSNKHSFKNTLGLSVELHEDAITGEQNNEDLPDGKTLQKEAVGRLFILTSRRYHFFCSAL